MSRTKVAIIGSGNIGTDLMIKVMRHSEHLEMGAMVGIDPDSDGLARAARMGVPVTAAGVAGLVELPGFDEIEIVFDATSARAHLANDARLRPLGKRLIDPPLMGKVERLNSIAVLVGVMFWTFVWGAWGTLLAVPLLAVTKTICDRVNGLQAIGQLLGR